MISFEIWSSGYPWELYLLVAMPKVESILLVLDVCDSCQGRKMYMNCIYEIRIRSLDVRQSQQMEKQ